VVFDARYSNGSLCACGKIQKKLDRRSEMCQEKLSSLDIIINFSTNTIEEYKVVCDIVMKFFPTTEGDFSPRQITIFKSQLSEPTPNVSLSMVNDNGVSYAVSKVLPTSSVATSKSGSAHHPAATPILHPKSRILSTLQTSSVIRSVLRVCKHLFFCPNDGQLSNLYTIFLSIQVLVAR
jgi:hypothetical protein